MSVRFSIQNTASKAERESDNTIVRFTGTAEYFSRLSERDCKKVGQDDKGNPKLIFNTGLDEKQVQFYKWYSEEEQQVIKSKIKELRPLIVEFYGGEDVIESKNYYFWKEDRNVNKLALSPEKIDVFFDTSKPEHALLFLSIASGAFMELVAPTREWAETRQIPHYMALEEEGVGDVTDEIEITRSDAHMALGELRAEYGKEALFLIAWCLQYDTNAFGAYNNSVSEKDLVKYHIQYINGKLVTKRKKNTAKLFLEYANKWKGQLTKGLIYTEAYIRAGEYYGFVNQRNKKFETIDGTVLGNTIQDAVKELSTAKLTQDLEKLRDLVKAKWDE
jgi:hypothetical protein